MLNLIGQILNRFDTFRRRLHKKPGGWKYKLIEAERVQKALKAKKGGVAFIGDSIFHFGEKYLSSLGDVYAVGGYTTHDVIRTIRTILAAAQPRLVILHIGGNDLMAGDSVADVERRIKEIGRICKEMNVKMKWVEVVPLGDPDDYPNLSEEYLNKIKTVNGSAIKLCQRIVRNRIDWIKIRNRLSQFKIGIYLEKEYGAGDMVHVNDRAYQEVYVPVLRSEI